MNLSAPVSAVRRHFIRNSGGYFKNSQGDRLTPRTGNRPDPPSQTRGVTMLPTARSVLGADVLAIGCPLGIGAPSVQAQAPSVQAQVPRYYTPAPVYYCHSGNLGRLAPPPPVLMLTESSQARYPRSTRRTCLAITSRPMRSSNWPDVVTQVPFPSWTAAADRLTVRRASCAGPTRDAASADRTASQ